jgi:hypothetical protein
MRQMRAEVKLDGLAPAPSSGRFHARPGATQPENGAAALLRGDRAPGQVVPRGAVQPFKLTLPADLSCTCPSHAMRRPRVRS